MSSSPLYTSNISPTFSWIRSLRLSSFQIGSAMGEILTASVWNRVMTVELGLPIAFVSALLALQYLLLPISLWAGFRSDNHHWLGLRRTNYIWLGRFVMLFSFPMLFASVRQIEIGQTTFGWLLALLSFLLFGSGKLFSGSIFLALVRESAPPEKRGVAVSLVETVLIVFIIITSILFSRLLPHYNFADFGRLVAITTLTAAFFWWFALYRIEETVPHPTTPTRATHNFRQSLAKMWQQSQTRAFFLFLGLATFSAWMQDAILEPFGGRVFALPTAQTTRFTSYWGTFTLLLILLCYVVRRQKPEKEAPLTIFGLISMATGMGLLALSAYMHNTSLIMVGLFFYGAGFGLYTYGGLSLMAVMSPTSSAGEYLGLWTVCVLVTKGLGTVAGGVLVDLFGRFFTPSLAFMLTFSLSALGLLFAAQKLSKIDFPEQAT